MGEGEEGVEPLKDQRLPGRNTKRGQNSNCMALGLITTKQAEDSLR